MAWTCKFKFNNIFTLNENLYGDFRSTTSDKNKYAMFMFRLPNIANLYVSSINVAGGVIESTITSVVNSSQYNFLIWDSINSLYTFNWNTFINSSEMSVPTNRVWKITDSVNNVGAYNNAVYVAFVIINGDGTINDSLIANGLEIGLTDAVSTHTDITFENVKIEGYSVDCGTVSHYFGPYPLGIGLTTGQYKVSV